jgi:hypothetical protein
LAHGLAPVERIVEESRVELARRGTFPTCTT